jgi:plasmid stability protein
MATLTIRKLDDGVYARLGDRARAHNRSLEAEVRTILEREATQPESFDIDAWLAEARALRRRTPPLPDGRSSLDILRDERESG